jgi:hypothetical protein
MDEMVLKIRVACKELIIRYIFVVTGAFQGLDERY